MMWPCELNIFVSKTFIFKSIKLSEFLLPSIVRKWKCCCSLWKVISSSSFSFTLGSPSCTLRDQDMALKSRSKPRLRIYLKNSSATAVSLMTESLWSAKNTRKREGGREREISMCVRERGGKFLDITAKCMCICVRVCVNVYDNMRNKGRNKMKKRKRVSKKSENITWEFDREKKREFWGMVDFMRKTHSSREKLDERITVRLYEGEREKEIVWMDCVYGKVYLSEDLYSLLCVSHR